MGCQDIGVLTEKGLANVSGGGRACATLEDSDFKGSRLKSVNKVALACVEDIGK